MFLSDTYAFRYRVLESLFLRTGLCGKMVQISRSFCQLLFHKNMYNYCDVLHSILLYGLLITFPKHMSNGLRKKICVQFSCNFPTQAFVPSPPDSHSVVLEDSLNKYLKNKKKIQLHFQPQNALIRSRYLSQYVFLFRASDDILFYTFDALVWKKRLKSRFFFTRLRSYSNPLVTSNTQTCGFSRLSSIH